MYRYRIITIKTIVKLLNEIERKNKFNFCYKKMEETEALVTDEQRKKIMNYL
jgi:hypothetical protein